VAAAVLNVPATMKALVVLEPNHFQIQEVPVPEPGPNQVLARVRAVSICGTDAHLVRGDYPGFWPPAFPFIPGHEWAGDIVAMGPGAADFGWKIGDRVAGTSHDACGVCQKCVEGHYNLCENYGVLSLHKQYGHNVQGADATYVVHGVKAIFHLPDGLSYAEGAVIDPASIALHVANRGGVRPGDRVAITGAGAIGLLAGDAALVRGASRVIVLENNKIRLAKAAEFGFETVDSGGPDPVAAVRAATDGQGVDVVLECAGVPATVQLALGFSAREAGAPPWASPPRAWRSPCSAWSWTSWSWSAAGPPPARCATSCHSWSRVGCGCARSPPITSRWPTTVRRWRPSTIRPAGRSRSSSSLSRRHAPRGAAAQPRARLPGHEARSDVRARRDAQAG